MTVADSVAARAERSERLRGPAITITALAAATVALHVRDPHVQHSWGFCPLYALTGIYCPGCGGLRAVNDLTNGHVGAAASSNLLLVVAIPVVVLLLGRWTLISWRGTGEAVIPPLPRAVKVGLLVVVAAFWVARNLPGSWLAP
jgi:hypothetical protein